MLPIQVKGYLLLQLIFSDKFWATVVAAVYKFYCQQIVPSFLMEALPSDNFHTKQLSQRQEDQQIQWIKFLFLQCAPYFMLLGHKLVNAAQTKIILSNIGFNKSGITPERILNCFNFKMFLSTRVLSDATQQVYVVPLADKHAPRQ